VVDRPSKVDLDALSPRLRNEVLRQVAIEEQKKLEKEAQALLAKRERPACGVLVVHSDGTTELITWPEDEAKEIAVS
jgi:hypothetical protein